MALNVNKIIRDVRNKVEKEFDRLAANSVARLKDQLSTQYPPASQPGHVPHRRTGTLQEGIASIVETEGNKVTMAIVSKAPYSEYLEYGIEYGTAKMAARPFMRPEFARLKNEAVVAVKKALS